MVQTKDLSALGLLHYTDFVFRILLICLKTNYSLINASIYADTQYHE